jgi:hypothetical protein
VSFPKTQKWERTLSGTPSADWLTLIEQHTVEGFKSILSSQQPPTVSRLESLEWSNTPAAGVYGWILEPKEELTFGDSDFHDSECYLYLGTASSYGGGLACKRQDLLSPWPSARQKPPRLEICDLGLSHRKLVTVLEIPFLDSSDEEIRRIRTLVALARAVFVIWLGAVKPVWKPAIDGLTPWRQQDIPYHGLACHNPLVYDIKVPPDMRTIGEDEELRKERAVQWLVRWLWSMGYLRLGKKT